MSDKIVNFPYNSERERRRNVQKGIVPCQISSRYLKLNKETSIFTEGEFIRMDIMTSTLDKDLNEKQRKLCEIIITRENLMAVLEECKETVE